MSASTLLVTSAELVSRQHDPAWVVFDCRHDLMDVGKGERAYRAGHIPGARFAHLDSDLSGEKNGLRGGRHPLPSPVAFAAFLARNGVSDSSTVIAYDDVGGAFAARLWWLCRWIGLPNVGLLDGGIGRWIADGNTLSTEVPPPRHTALRASAAPQMQVSAAEVLLRLHARDYALIDARPPERFRGDVEPIDPVAGHIPGARNHFYKENLNADLTFKPAEMLRVRFEQLRGEVPVENITHQCGSGVTACANLFAMELAGLPGSTLYAGSWSEWITDPQRPIVRGSAAR